MAEDPKQFLRNNSKPINEVDQALKSISSGNSKCFYYPGCGNDFIYPLQNFSDKCDTFVFCDWEVGYKDSFLKQINTIKAERPEGITDVAPDWFHVLLPESDVKELANMEDIRAKFVPEIPSNLRRFLDNPPSQETHYAEMWITTSGGEKKFVRVFWLRMEGVNIYLKLFAQHKIAPHILCIKNWGQNASMWTAFGDWQAHLAQVVQSSPRKPEFLVACKGAHDWPWTLREDEFSDWDDPPVIMWRRKEPDSAQPVAPQPQKENIL